MRSDSQKFINLIYKTAAKWVNWDPPKRMSVGDFGTIDEDTGEFQWQGTIYSSGLLDPRDRTLDPQEQELGDDQLTITSSSVSVQVINAGPEANIAAIADAAFKVEFQLEVSARGAVLIVHRPRYTSLPNDPRVIKLLRSRPDILRGKSVVTEVISCPAYLMYLTGQGKSMLHSTSQKAFTVSLTARVPTSVPGLSAGGQAGFTWSSQAATGISRHGGDPRCIYTPLYKLKKLSRGFWDRLRLRGHTPTPGVDDWDDVEPPWEPEDEAMMDEPSVVTRGDDDDLYLHFEGDEELDSLREAIADQENVSVVRKENADLGLVLDDGKVVFNVLDTMTATWGLTRMPYPLKENTPQTFFPILYAAAHYYRHLRLRDSQYNFQQDIEIEFTRVLDCDEFDDDYLPIYEPTGPNLFQNNIIELEIGENSNQIKYGMKVRNNGDKPLYLAVFYFDSSDLSIHSYYQSPANKGTAPLLAHNSLTVGYGGTNTYPRPYFLREGQDVDVGYLKLFLSTEYIDWSHVAQKSPFLTRGIAKAAIHTVSTVDALRDAICIPMIQRRALQLSSDGLAGVDS